MAQPYTRAFFESRGPGSRASAREVVPLLMQLLPDVRSVVDVGCGSGAWLAEFQAHGVADAVGVDGSYVSAEILMIPPDRFVPHDLAAPLHLGRTFDLVVSLEVAEHLPPDAADSFVGSLVGLGPVVAFSAAIPEQGGTHHVNEQWPEYWAERFARHGYVAVDCVRPAVWRNAAIDWWYAQNLILFAAGAALSSRPGLRRGGERSWSPPLPLVHPRNYLRSRDSAAAAWAEHERLALVARDLAGVIPADATTVLIDQGQLHAHLAPWRRVLPFLERDGEYWGPPPDDATAAAELERMRAAGATHLVLAWPAFWWREHYHDFVAQLHARFGVLLDNVRACVYDLRA